ncbi:Odorant receptor coreceptor, partial [Gryllus bimaculatus]
TLQAHTNNVFFSLVYFACTQFRALNDSLRELRAEALLRVSGHARNERAFQQEMAHGLRQAVLHHQAIISLVDAVQNLLDPVMFMECLAMSIMLCCVTFQATMVSPTSVKFLALALFLLFEMMELLLFCSVGTQLELLSRTVADAAFDCGWEDCAPPFKSSLRFMMMRAQKPSRVTAMGFATLSLPLFM